MNYVRACLYLWVLISAGTALANFIGIRKKCNGCSRYETFENVNSIICSKSISCPQCDGQTECQKVAALSQRCSGCGEIRNLRSNHKHKSVACPSCVVAGAESVDLVPPAQDCRQCGPQKTMASIGGSGKKCNTHTTCHRCGRDTKCPMVEVHFYQCSTCKTIKDIDNKHSHNSVVCPACVQQCQELLAVPLL
ncbi:hypothetical protein DFH28DRAFT_697927 [Melampsora americana]|nr:hypothetical protein DFH28DRAFT_697927 [Melampsora americana]